MSFCARCDLRTARCHRRCDREANGRHLWRVIQLELARVRGGSVSPHLAWERQPGDVRRAYVAGAQDIRAMGR